MNIKEMAKLAGVSCATISRVLNDSGYVKEDTRKKVMEIIREYNYTPNMIARSLSSKDSFNIGIIIPNVGEKQYGKILEGAAKETAKHGYSLVFMDSENDPKAEKKWLEEVKNQHMKGLVLVPVCSENKELRGALQELEEQGTAVVLTEKDVKNAGMDGVFADEFRGAYEGICRLIEKGCKRIGIAVGQMENDAATEERYRGCVQALEDNGIALPEELILREVEDINRVLQGKKLPDALFALNETAVGQCFKELFKGKKQGTEKILFMGMDAEKTAKLLEDEMLSVERDGRKQGKEAVKLLLEAFDTEDFIAKGKAEKVDLVLFSNPNNPTGQIIKKKDLCRIAAAFDCPVIIDEAYGEFADDTMIDQLDRYENLFVTRTLSKAFALAAVRCGFLIGNKAAMKKIRSCKVPYNVNTMTQCAAQIVLSNRDELLKRRDEIIQERSRMEQACARYDTDLLRIYPSHANFFYGRSSRKEELLKLFEKQNIVIRNYADDSFRITIGTKEENDQVLAVLQSFEEEYR